MSKVQTSAERSPHDLSRFIFSTGAIGRLKVIDHCLVQPGDSYDLSLNGALRLSPLRRGLVIDSRCDIFSFYVPHRHTYGQEFVDFLKAGPNTGLRLSNYVFPQTAKAEFLGIHNRVNAVNREVPKYLLKGYLNIYNNYFKNPYDADKTDSSLTWLSDSDLSDGLQCANLKTLWTAPLPPNVQSTHEYNADPDNDGMIDIMGLNAAYGQLHTEQERALFARRYRDLVEKFGGSTTFDADQRPRLLMRSKFWASGYDVDGTDAQSLGQFSGRVQQVFSHNVPRFFVPEHGVVITVMVMRFPPTHAYSSPYLVLNTTPTYEQLVGDPAIDGNYPPVDLPSEALWATTHTGAPAVGGVLTKVPWGQWHRSMPDHVDYRFIDNQGFPFLWTVPTGHDKAVMVSSSDYDQCFQTVQLGHWNMQVKATTTIMRRLPSARDSLMTS